MAFWSATKRERPPQTQALGSVSTSEQTSAPNLSDSAGGIPPSPLRRRFRQAAATGRLNELGLAVALIVLIVILSNRTPFFLTTPNILNIGRAIAITGIVAAVTTLVLIAGELDLSIGATIAMGGIAAAKALEAGAPLGVVLFVGAGAGLLIGLTNAVFIVFIGVNALMMTIASAFVWRGVGFIWTDGNAVNTFGHSGFAFLGQNDVLGGVPASVVLVLGVFVVVGFTLSFTKFGSHIYAIGGSQSAARLAGVAVPRVRVIVYCLSGISAAFAGVLLASSSGSANPISGTGIELTIIGAVILGGTSLTLGRGTVVGTFLGVVFLGALVNGMNLLGLAAYWQIFIQGVALVIAVTIDEIVRKRLVGG